MDGNYKIDLYDWIKTNVEMVVLDGVSKDIDLDEIIDVVEDKTKMLKSSLDIFNYMCEIIAKLGIESINFHLSIDLISEYNILQKAPTTIQELIDNIDDYSTPNFILYKLDVNTELPIAEFYRSPILIENIGLNGKASLFYFEFRDKESIESNFEYLRDVKFIYNTSV